MPGKQHHHGFAPPFGNGMHPVRPDRFGDYPGYGPPYSAQENIYFAEGNRMNGASSNSYTVDHLVTWSIGPQHGVLTHEDGMRQLSRMEQQSGVYTMRCALSVGEQSVDITESATRDLREQFPMDCVRDPVAARDKNSIFSNIALFTVIEDPKNKHSPSEMHIFQVIGRPAKDLVDEIMAAKSSYLQRVGRSSSTRRSQAEIYGNVAVQDAVTLFESEHQSESRPKVREQVRARKLLDDDQDQDESLQNGVALLNRCFDDIERFVARLKQSAQAMKELSQRRRSKRHLGEGMLTMRSRTPAPQEFVELFQKFKLCFNILARLRPYLHKPNSAEFAHFLITPLGLLVEASRDPRHDFGDLVGKVVSPLLTIEAIDLLNNCLTSKEYELWMSLGVAWRTPRRKWPHGHVAAYRPIFNDGWQPAEAWLEPYLGSSLAAAVASTANKFNRNSDPDSSTNDVLRNPSKKDTTDNGLHRRMSDRIQSPVSPRSPTRPSFSVEQKRSTAQIHEPRFTEPSLNGADKSFLRELQSRNAKIYEVIQDRKANNAQELGIQKGEILEVLNDERNWWKCSNVDGVLGYVPYTLLKKYEADAERDGLADIPPAPPNQPPPPPVLPPSLRDGGSNSNNDGNWKFNKRSSNKAAKSKSNSVKDNNDFDHELRQRLSRISLSESNNSRNNRPIAATSPQVFIDQFSSPPEVDDWLEKKGFQDRTRKLLEGFNGKDILQLDADEIVRVLGSQEGARLASQLKLMKTTSGYTKSGAELKAVLERQKRKTSSADQEGDLQSNQSSNDGSSEKGYFEFDDSDDETGGSHLQRQLRSKRLEMRQKH